MFKAIADGFGYLFSVIWSAVVWVMNGLYRLFQPVFEFIGAIFYFVYKLGVILYKVLEIVLAIGRMLIGLSTGLFKTILGLSYNPATASPIPESYSSVIAKLQPALETLQFNKVAYVLMFVIWITTAIFAMRIIGGFRGAGGE
ncbi:hypothetical protein [Paenibacillus sp. MMO-177]|uniref:hypothetical protein n=1 Tax=Paenibacillus sp. MMO-177 TaxID=3081289 RepID=UPI0030177763